jgi:Type II intron maturase
VEHWHTLHIPRQSFRLGVYRVLLLTSKGATTPGVDEVTLDGFSEERVTSIITRLKSGTYRFQPVRRTYVPKKNGKKRPLGISSGDDKLVQEVVRIILERIYEPIFDDHSHGFRSGRSPHTAFVGYELKTYSADRVIKLKRGTRHTWVKSLSEQIQLHLPQDTMQKFCAQRGYGNYATGKATHKPQWMNLTDAEIILAYNGEFRGLANYYALATGVKKTLHKLEWIWQTSLLKTLANKHKTGVNKMVKQLKTQEGLRLAVKREQETRYINVFRLKDRRSPAPHNPQPDVQLNGYVWTLSFSEVTKRLNRKRCEYCETTEGPFEVHHV